MGGFTAHLKIYGLAPARRLTAELVVKGHLAAVRRLARRSAAPPRRHGETPPLLSQQLASAVSITARAVARRMNSISQTGTRRRRRRGDGSLKVNHLLDIARGRSEGAEAPMSAAPISRSTPPRTVLLGRDSLRGSART